MLWTYAARAHIIFFYVYFVNHRWWWCRCGGRARTCCGALTATCVTYYYRSL